MDMIGFLASTKKEKTSTKKKGILDEKQADAISSELDRLLCTLVIKQENLFLGIYSDAVVMHGKIHFN